MKKLTSTTKYLISLIVSLYIGDFFTDILESRDMNVWIARAIGCGICVIIGLLFFRFWIKDEKRV